MISQSKIIECLEQIAPPEKAAGFDNVGLLWGRRDKDIAKILLCLDADINVVREAAQLKADMIISHHPVIFDALRRVTDDDAQGDALLCAAENSISIYSAHTNFDEADGGMNDSLAAMLDLKVIKPLSEDGGSICETSSPITLGALCAKIKDALGIKRVYATHSPAHVIRTAAICTGGGGFLAQHALRANADCYISGDLKHSQILQMAQTNTAYIEIRHYESEIIFTRLMAQKLSSAFGNRLDICISQSGTNPLTEVCE